MAERPDDYQPEEEEERTGAVKTFLEHLEDLRWVLIKSAAAILSGMMLCLFCSNRLMSILKWPLDQASHRHIAFLPDITNQWVVFQIGGAQLPPMDVKTNRLGGIDLGTNPVVTIQLEPVQLNGLTVLSLRPVPTLAGVGAGTGGGPGLVYFDPSEPFLASFRMAFFGGLLLASPFLSYFIGQFLLPALKVREKKYFLPVIAAAVFLFLAGASIAFFVIMPTALKFAQQYGEWMGVSVPYWTADSYVGFVVKFMLGMGLGFELPVVLLALVKIGVLDYAKLSSMRRYVIVANFILGALLTTPEVLTQVVMGLALQLLYEVSVWIAWYWERQEKKAQKD